METDPTRHSKSNADPRTIDLSADEVKTVAPGEAEGADEDVTATAAAEPDMAAGEATEAAQPEATAEPIPAAAAPAPRPRSAASLVASSFVVGVVVLAGAAGLQYWGVLPSMNNDSKALDAVNAMTGDVSALKAEIAALKEAKPQVDLSPVNDKIAAIEAKLTDLPKPNGLSADADARLGVLGDEVGALKTAGAEQKKADEEARTALLMRLEALEKKASEPRDDVQVAVAIASAGLKAAIDRGGSFASELDTLGGIDPANPAIKELKTFAATGVPSRAALLADFPGVADRILAAVNTGDPNQSLTDRLMASAFSAIKVRPVGEVEGDTPEAKVARMEAKLTNGDLKGAEAEWQALPKAGKDASVDFQKSLSARIRVEELVGSTLSRAVQGTETKG
jgi:hypothetical protein